MALDSQKFALAAAGALGAAYTVCAFFCWATPQLCLDLTATMLHLNSLDMFMPFMSVSPRVFLLGLGQVFLYTYAIVLLWLGIYNRLK